MRSKAVSETRFMGVSLFAMAVVITWSAFAYVAFCNKDIALPVMKICNIMTAIAAIVGVAYIYTSSHLSYDEDLERLHARRDAAVLLSLAVDFITTNTLLGLLIDAMNHDISIVSMMSTPATMAGIVIMVTAVVSMIVLTVIGKAERQLQQDMKRLEGGKEIRFRQGQDIVTSYDMHRDQLASRAYYDKDAKASGEIQSYIPLSQVGITKIGKPSEHLTNITKAKPAAEQVTEKKETPLKDTIAEVVAKKKAQLAKILPEIDKKHTDRFSGDDSLASVPSPEAALDDATSDELGHALDKPTKSESKALHETDLMASGTMDWEPIGDDGVLVATTPSTPGATQPSDEDGDGNDAVSEQDAETRETSVADTVPSHATQPPLTGANGVAESTDDGFINDDDAEESPENRSEGDNEETSVTMHHEDMSMLRHLTEFFATIGEHCVALGGRAKAWLDRTWPVVANRASELVATCRDAVERAWKSVVAFVQDKSPIVKERISSVGHRIADGATTLAERGASIARSVIDKRVTVAEQPSEADAEDEKKDDGTNGTDPISEDVSEPIFELTPDATSDARERTVATAIDDENLTVDPMGQEPSQSDESPAGYMDFSDKAVPPFMKEMWDTPYMKKERH